MSSGGSSAAAWALLALACYSAAAYVLRGRSVGFFAMLVGIAGAVFHDVLIAA
jgi:hypothetical protein